MPDETPTPDWAEEDRQLWAEAQALEAALEALADRLARIRPEIASPAILDAFERVDLMLGDLEQAMADGTFSRVIEAVSEALRKKAE